MERFPRPRATLVALSLGLASMGAWSQTIQGFTVLNADTGAVLQTTVGLDGTVTLSGAAMPARIAVRADASNVRSVVFTNGTRRHIENIFPYALYGDTVTAYRPWAPASGTYDITATPHSMGGGTGQAGPTAKLRLVVDRAGTANPGLPGGPTVKISGQKRLYASTTQDNNTAPANVIDDSATTRWASGVIGRAWLMMDLGAPARIDRVEIDWERAWSSKYTLEVSNDRTNWTRVGAEQTNPQVIDTVTANPPAAEYQDVIPLSLSQAYRYIRINSTERGWSAGNRAQFGVSVLEFRVFGAGGQNNPAPIAEPPVPTGNYVQVWADEFDSGAAKAPVDPTKWNYMLGDGCDRGICGWGNRELQFYTNSLENVYQQNGLLNIELRKNHLGRAYTSGRITTAKKYEFTYGRVVGRIKINTPNSSAPGAKDGPVGVWGAFWTLGFDVDDPYVGWPNSGEIDIMENIGYSWWHSSALHGPGYSGGGSVGGAWNRAETPTGIGLGGDPSFKSSDWHTYEVEWEPTKIVFSVDGRVYRTIERSEVEARGPWVYNKPNFLILNLAYDGEYPAAFRNQARLYSGAKDPVTGLALAAEQNFPHTMQVDYVRVFQKR